MNRYILRAAWSIGFIFLNWFSVTYAAANISTAFKSEEAKDNVTLIHTSHALRAGPIAPSSQTLQRTTRISLLVDPPKPIKPLIRVDSASSSPRDLPVAIANYCKSNGLLFDLTKIGEDIVFSEDEKPRIDADAEAFILRMEENKKFLIEYAVPWLFKDNPATQAAFWYGLNYHITTFFFDKLEGGKIDYVRKIAQMVVNALVGLCEAPEASLEDLV